MNLTSIKPSGYFEGYASVFGKRDLSGDIVAPGAFAKSLKDTPASEVMMLWQHHVEEPAGVWDEVFEDDKGLFVRGRIIDEPSVIRPRSWSWEGIAKGEIDGLSIGFRAMKYDRLKNMKGRLLKELKLVEISIVTFPLLPISRITKTYQEELLRYA